MSWVPVVAAVFLPRHPRPRRLMTHTCNPLAGLEWTRGQGSSDGAVATLLHLPNRLLPSGIQREQGSIYRGT